MRQERRSANSKLPAFQFYPGDWRKDPGVQALSFHDRGVWFEILCFMHESEERGKLLLNGIVMPDDALARLLGLDKQVLTKTLTTLATFGVASRDPETGALMSRRMVRDEEIRKIRQKAGKMGGNPRLLNQAAKQKSTPSSSSSVSSSNNTPLPPEGGIDGYEIPSSLDTKEFKGEWSEFIAHRKALKKKLTPQSARMQLTKLEAMGHDKAIAAIRHSIANGWQGIFEPAQQALSPTAPHVTTRKLPPIE